jgi:hypothetical protein
VISTTLPFRCRSIELFWPSPYEQPLLTAE